MSDHLLAVSIGFSRGIDLIADSGRCVRQMRSHRCKLPFGLLPQDITDRCPLVLSPRRTASEGVRKLGFEKGQRADVLLGRPSAMVRIPDFRNQGLQKKDEGKEKLNSSTSIITINYRPMRDLSCLKGRSDSSARSRSRRQDRRSRL